jgi:hypothetical protein
MMTRRWWAGSAAGAIVTAALWVALGPASPAGEVVRQRVPADAIAAIENAETFTLYSLDPKKPGPDDARERFYDWPVLGRADVADPAVRKQLVAALWKGVEESDGTIANCFNPRHGVRVAHKGMTVDFILCFECLTVRVTDGKRRGTFVTTGSPQPSFDGALTDLKVPLAPKPGH